MIEWLRAGKTANFYSLTQSLTNSTVDDLFRDIRGSHSSPSQNVFCHRRVRSGEAFWSSICFLFHSSPSFLLEEAYVRDRICGFLLIVEYRDHLAVFKSRLNTPVSFATRYLGRVSSDRVDVAIARHDAVFEKIRLRSMSVSKFALRNKTLEADDLGNTVGPAGSSRYAPQGYRVRAGADHFSATPSTGRIAQRSDRVGLPMLVEYAKTIIDELVDGSGTTAPFIRTFARAIDLESIQGAARPTTFAVDVAGLGEALHEQGEIRLVRKQGGARVVLTKAEVDAVLAELDRVFEVRGNEKLLGIHDRDNDNRVGAIAINKARIALRDLSLPLTSELEVEWVAHAGSQDPDRLALRQYIDREDGFIVLFDNLSLAYLDGTLFRDESLIGGGSNLMRHLRTEPTLAAVTDEKGTLTPRHAAFDRDSTFGVVVASVSEGDDVLVCDDLGDEWADFIGLNNASSPPRVTFYHAKHGALSLGAKPFHISVSQAIKNLGRLNLSSGTMAGKFRKWRGNYKGDRTSIPRISRGNSRTLAADFERAQSAPDAIRRVFIVTSSLSFRAVQRALAGIAAGRTPDPHFVQLYWLLLSFFSACLEVGAHGYIVCQE